MAEKLAYLPYTGPAKVVNAEAANEPKVDTPHPDFEEYGTTWARIRDCIKGADQIRRMGDLYLPRLSEQNNDEFRAYMDRAKFVGFTAATVEMMNGFIFRKPPDDATPAALDDFIDDCTLSNMSWYQYEKEVVYAANSVGRSGTLVDWSDSDKRPYCASYAAEQILNWKQQRIEDKMVLTLLVLTEQVGLAESGQTSDPFCHDQETHWRVYKLDQSTEEPFVICEVYRKNDHGKFEIVGGQVLPNRKGTNLSRIPFIFHGCINGLPDVNRPPMSDISDLNIKHYTQSADLENGRHFCGLPTAWAKCFDFKSTDGRLRVGSNLLLSTDNPAGEIGYLEFKGEGLKSLETGIKETEAQLAALGARMLEEQKGDEAYQTVQMRQSGQSAALIQTAESCTETLSKILKLAVWWMDSGIEYPEDIDDEKASSTLNIDFVEVTLQRGEIQEMQGLVQAGLISRDSFHAWLQKAEIVPDDRDLEEEQALINARPPSGMMSPTGVMGSPMPAPPPLDPNKTIGKPGFGQGSKAQAGKAGQSNEDAPPSK